MKKKLLYICGMGHSGSTILNLALDQSPQIAGVSQLANLKCPFDPFEVPEAERTEMHKFWIAVLDAFSEVEQRLIQEVHESTSREKNLAAMALSASARAPLARITSKLTQVILEKLGATVLVDSSKNISRALALTACSEIDVYHLHLIRDVRGLINSHNKRRAETRKPLAYLRPTFHWTAKNAAASLLLPRLAPKMLVARYEQMLTDPDAFVDSLENLIGEDLSPTRAALKGEVEMSTNGTVAFAGNRVLQSRSSRFRTGKLETGGVFDSSVYWYGLGWLATFWGYSK